MNVLAHGSRRFAILSVGVAAAAGIGPGIASGESAASLPDPCAILTKVQPENTIAKGQAVAVKLGKLVKYGSGSSGSLYCPEMVGKLTVSITVSHSAGGFGGVQITSRTHPTGLGSGDELIVGHSPAGAPVDFIAFHTSKAYVSISANGASPASLTTLARQVYALIR